MARLRHPLIVSTLIACGVMLVILAWAPRWTAARVAAGLHERINAADEAPAAALVEQLARLDDAALSHLVELLDDPRQQVRAAAREAIRQQVQSWSDQRTAQSERSVVSLATHLAAHEGPRDLHSRVFLKLTALKLLQWPLEQSTTDRVRFLADCSKILERTAVSEAKQTPLSVPQLKVAELSAPYSAELPQEPLTESPSDATEPTPELLPRGEAQPLPPERIEPVAPQRIRSGEIKIPADFVDEQALRALPTRSLIRQLQGTPSLAEAAERELRRRGFEDASLKLARALDDPDPRIREQLAESLPRLSGVDPAPWLWELAEDEDENVRRVARSILATSNNPKTRARVGRLK